MKVQQAKLIEAEYGKDLVTVLADVDAVRDDILTGKRWRPNDSETLSRASVKLAALVSYIGEFVSEAEYDASTFKNNYKLEFERAKLGYITAAEKKTIAEAEARALEDTQELLDNQARATYIHKLLQLKRADTSDLIDAIRSRLSFTKSERGQLN